MLLLLYLAYYYEGECEVCCSKLTEREQMTYTYYQNTGRFIGGEGEWKVDTIGYSGKGDGRNNPKSQCIKNIGPAPATQYTLGECTGKMKRTKIRPCSFPMIPVNEQEMCGRNAIFIHGCKCCDENPPECDETEPPCGDCSQGCIILNRQTRMKLREGDIINVKH